MSLKKRPSESFWIVFSFDPALVVVPDEQMRQFLLTKDVSKLPVNIDTKTVTTTGEAVAMVRIKPMSRKAFTMWQSNPIGLRYDLVRTHVIEAHNIEGAVCDVDHSTGETCLTKKSMDDLDQAVIDEIFNAIYDSGKGADGADRPFTLPDSFVGDRIRSRQLAANRVRADMIAEKPAKKKPTKK